MKFKVGDYVRYESGVGVNLAKIVDIYKDVIYCIIIEDHRHSSCMLSPNGIKCNICTHKSVQTLDHVWKVNYINTPLYKKLQGLDIKQETCYSEKKLTKEDN